MKVCNHFVCIPITWSRWQGSMICAFVIFSGILSSQNLFPMSPCSSNLSGICVALTAVNPFFCNIICFLSWLGTEQVSVTSCAVHTQSLSLSLTDGSHPMVCAFTVALSLQNMDLGLCHSFDMNAENPADLIKGKQELCRHCACVRHCSSCISSNSS